MTAPDIDTLYMLEDQIEPAVQKILEDNGFKASIQREAEPREAPYINVQLTVGAARNHMAMQRGRAYRDAWDGSLALEIVTRRKDDRAGNGATEHSRMRAKVRRIMQIGERLFGSNALPYHALTDIVESGTQPQVSDDDGLDRSIITFSLVISIRSIAWP